MDRDDVTSLPAADCFTAAREKFHRQRFELRSRVGCTTHVEVDNEDGWWEWGAIGSVGCPTKPPCDKTPSTMLNFGWHSTVPRET